MTIRYGVGGNSYCGARTVTYQPEGCAICLPIKMGEVQLFEVDFSSEVRCSPTRVGCLIDYNEIVDVTSITAVPSVVFGSGNLSVIVNDINRNGKVGVLVDATNTDLLPDEKWSITVSVELENKVRLKQCFFIRLIPCGDTCSVGSEPSISCNGPVLNGSEATCGNGNDVYCIGDLPSGAVCVEIVPVQDVFYSLDGFNPSDPNSVPVLLNAGNKLCLTNPTEISNFKMEAADCNCTELCVTTIFRGPAA